MLLSLFLSQAVNESMVRGTISRLRAAAAPTDHPANAIYSPANVREAAQYDLKMDQNHVYDRARGIRSSRVARKEKIPGQADPETDKWKSYSNDVRMMDEKWHAKNTSVRSLADESASSELIPRHRTARAPSF
jgi:hypothetical protein